MIGGRWTYVHGRWRRRPCGVASTGAGSTERALLLGGAVFILLGGFGSSSQLVGWIRGLCKFRGCWCRIELSMTRARALRCAVASLLRLSSDPRVRGGRACSRRLRWQGLDQNDRRLVARCLYFLRSRNIELATRPCARLSALGHSRNGRLFILG